MVPFFNFVEHKASNDVTKEDIEKFTITLKKQGKKESTRQKNIIELRCFFNWLKPDNDFFENIKVRRPKPDHSEKEFVNASDVVQMLPYCVNQRDRAFVFLLWESAARLDEILSLNLEHVKVEKYGIIIRITGKTGKRDIRVIDCVPDLQLWLGQHHGKDSDPLFYTPKGTRLTHRGAQVLTERLAIRAGIKKHVHCNGFRHGHLTELSNLGFSEMQLRVFAGWGGSSEMPATYIHVKEKDVVHKLLTIKGLYMRESLTKAKVRKKKDSNRAKATGDYSVTIRHPLRLPYRQ